jgi:cbb3-type cytochrome c oxidase subunit III
MKLGKLGKLGKLPLLLGALACVACGDNKTNDHRGYTKAPLEQPTVLVKKEPTTPMAGLGTPVVQSAPIIEAEKDTAKDAGKTGGASTAAGAVPAGATAADVQAGEKIFASTGNCFTCHGPSATGTAMAPSLSDQKWLHIDGSWDAIQKVVKSGVPKPKEHPAPMPAMGGAALTDEQVKQVAAYVYSMSHK